MYTLAQLSSAFEVMMKADFRLEMKPNDSVAQAEFDSAAEEYGRIVAYFESSPAVRLTDEAVYERDRFYHGLTGNQQEVIMSVLCSPGCMGCSFCDGGKSSIQTPKSEKLTYKLGDVLRQKFEDAKTKGGKSVSSSKCRNQLRQR